MSQTRDRCILSRVEVALKILMHILIIKLARNCSRVQLEGEGEAASSRESPSLLVPLPGLEEMTREVY